MKIFFVLFLFLALNTSASEKCSLTEDYVKARSEVGKIVYGDDNDYHRCQNAASEAEYWRALSVCIENSDGKNIGGGCAHLVGRGKYMQEPDTSHCEVFKFDPTPELAQNILDEIVTEKGIIKCKK